MNPDPINYLRGVLSRAAELGVSDIHLSVLAPVYFRRYGALEAVSGEDPLTRDQVDAVVAALLSDSQRQTFEETKSVDLAFQLEDPPGRYRINVFYERGRPALSVRRLDDQFRTLSELHLPNQLSELVSLRDGLVLVTGPTGSGKSTTLATMINQINHERSAHVVTIEDPIEYEHGNVRSLVRQRELHSDVRSFAEAVRASLREDPDVILVGEMRDAETARAAITAAETGHLVFSTLHTGDTVGAISRLLGIFPAEEQDAVRHELSLVLRSVVAQRLVRSVDQESRYPAVEILNINNAVANLIRLRKFEQIYSAIESGSAQGMQTFDQSLADLVASGRLTESDGRSHSRNVAAFEAALVSGRGRGMRRRRTGEGVRS